MSAYLNEINNLTKQNGLWVLKTPTGFNYSDGEASELFLKKIVSEAKDITSLSMELESCYPEWDWVAEYHLSSKRANLLRGLDLTGMNRVLEVGCGCGAITRYLGEKGLKVESIEGAERRAEIAQLRCRDLDHVHIINANFNNLILPDHTYDAVFVIGVIEYAKKFFSDAVSDEDAVVKILKLLQSALTENGVIVIAIENRNGLKYWLGATEDHYGKPYIGICDYWGQSGIKTYTINEWEVLLGQSGLKKWRFQFPFPDYKLPQVVLDENFIDHDEYAYSMLYRINSRDYLTPWQSGVSEFAIWKSLHSSGELKKFANSFLILAGKESVDFNNILPADFVYFSGGSRKPKYRTITIKPHQKDIIQKKNIWPTIETSDNFNVQQSLDSSYISGSLLSTNWLEATLNSDSGRYEALVRKYNQFIRNNLKNKPEDSLLDALPSNIVVDKAGDYFIIDQEWRSRDQLEPEFILFRSLFWFANNNQDLLRSFFHIKEISCILEFVEYGFQIISVSLKPLLANFIAREEKIQFDVSGQTHVSPIHQVLTSPIIDLPNKIVCSKLSWATDDQPFKDSNSLEMVYKSTFSHSKLIYQFVSEVRIDKLRFKPANEACFFKIQKILFTWREVNSPEPTLLWRTKSIIDLLSKVIINDAVLPFIKPDGVFYSSNGNATLDFHIVYPCIKEPSDGIFECTIEISHIPSLQYSWNKDIIRMTRNTIEAKNYEVINKISSELYEKRKEVDRAKLDQYGFNIRLAESNRKNTVLRDTLTSVSSEIASIHALLQQIGSLKVLQGVGRIFPGKYGWIPKKLARYTHKYYSQDEYETIRQSGLFDETYYISQHPDLEPFDGDAIHHYLAVGAYVELDPHRLFDTGYYYRQNPKLTAERINPLSHFLSVGAFEGKDPCYLFSTRFYLKKNPEIASTGINPLKHYIEKGVENRSDPHPVFDTSYYLDQYPEAQNSELTPTPLEHFFAVGEPQRKSPTALFDFDYYLEMRSNLVDTDISALRHFMEYGYIEGQNPSYLFKIEYYISDDDNLRQQQINPLVHFITHGQFENRSPNPLFDVTYYRENLADRKVKYSDLLSHYILRGALYGLNPHPLFDTDFYRGQICEADKTRLYPLKHYFQHGMSDRFDPHPLFNCGYYLSQFKGGELDTDDLLLYYDCRGANEDKDPHPLFDSKFYRTQMKKRDSGGQNPLVHYVRKGREKGMSTHPEFDVAYYKKKNPDIDFSSSVDPVTHYLYDGSQKGKWPSRSIEELTYKPAISLVCVVNGPDFRYLPGRVLSVMSQLYPRWDLSIVVRNPDESAGYQRVATLTAHDKRIHLIETDDTAPVSQLLNDALNGLTGEYIVFPDERMFLHANTLLTFVRKLCQNQSLSLIHADRTVNDRDLIQVARLCHESDADTVRFFIGPIACFKRSIIDQIGGFESWHQGAYDERFLIQYIRQSPLDTIVHISEPLHFTMYHDPLRIDVRPK